MSDALHHPVTWPVHSLWSTIHRPERIAYLNQQAPMYSFRPMPFKSLEPFCWIQKNTDKIIVIMIIIMPFVKKIKHGISFLSAHYITNASFLVLHTHIQPLWLTPKMFAYVCMHIVCLRIIGIIYTQYHVTISTSQQLRNKIHGRCTDYYFWLP